MFEISDSALKNYLDNSKNLIETIKFILNDRKLTEKQEKMLRDLLKEEEDLS